MKIFISHSSYNKLHGEALVELLRGIGIHDNEIIFTSNVAYGIPNGENIFNWLKRQINNKPYVIYLLSKEYYSSIACLNEMGAAWVIENRHTVIFTPEFDLSCKEFQNGAIDPREIGFFVSDEDRLYRFIEQIRSDFNISTNTVLVNQCVRNYLKTINSINSTPIIEPICELEKNLNIVETPPAFTGLNTIQTLSLSETSKDNYSKLVSDIVEKKLTEEELLLLHYIIKQGKTRLKTGWQEDAEVSDIKSWEEIEGFSAKLSQKYPEALRKFDLRKYTEVSARTSSGNAKEIVLKADIKSMILDFPYEVNAIINQAVDNNRIFGV